VRADTRRATGYSLVLPSPWKRIPLIGSTKATIRKVLDEAFASLPRDTIAPYRQEIEQRLAKAVSQARQTGGRDLYLPIGPKNDSVISASFVVSDFPLQFPPDADPDGLAAALASAEEGSEKVTVAGVPGIRMERAAGPDPGAGIEFGSRRVIYIISTPGNRATWMSISFSTLGAGDPDDAFAKLLVQLFDAIVSTLRWKFADE
jgi:hypothetical protein